MTSTFDTFPGLPIYASKDLINWKHVSHVWNRGPQLPGYSWATEPQQRGMWAATIRFHDGTFYVICAYQGVPDKDRGVLFKSTDAFDDSSWSDALTCPTDHVDPDIFWDDDGKAYIATSGIQVQEMDLNTGKWVGKATHLWDGMVNDKPEGPHINKKDGYYYLMIAEGGTGRGHFIAISRSENITGPYISNPNNPILTNRNTSEYFQAVGHGDLFQDAQGNWWGMCLSDRAGSAFKSYPMGRESVLFPVTWNTGEWPILEPVKGKMSGWPLPVPTRDLPGDGPFNSDPDVYDFVVGKKIPRNLIYWRVPRDRVITVTSEGLQIVPGRNQLSGWP